jgi:hypothetical protein
MPFAGSASQHLPSVRAAGKPSSVHGFTVGRTQVFMRGSDSVVYMLLVDSALGIGQWSSLGGVIYGDPSAVTWNGNRTINIFAVGTDDRLYTYGMDGVHMTGWVQVPNNGGNAFVSSPKAISASASTMDVFLSGENGRVWRVPFSSASGFSGAQNVGGMGEANQSPLTAISIAPGQLDVLGNADQDFGWLESRGAWGGATLFALSQGNGASGTPAVISRGANLMDAFGITKKNQLFHAHLAGGSFVGEVNPIATDAVGDPVAVNRDSTDMEVFYRNTSGSLTHLRWDGTSWIKEVVSGALIQ